MASQCVCQPDCAAKQCGGDGCGGSCGTCSVGTCNGAGQCQAPLSCPPDGPYGLNVGDIAPDVTLKDCDGNSYSVHDLCDGAAAWIFGFTGW